MDSQVEMITWKIVDLDSGLIMGSLVFLFPVEHKNID